MSCSKASTRQATAFLPHDCKPSTRQATACLCAAFLFRFLTQELLASHTARQRFVACAMLLSRCYSGKQHCTPDKWQPLPACDLHSTILTCSLSPCRHFIVLCVDSMTDMEAAAALIKDSLTKAAPSGGSPDSSHCALLRKLAKVEAEGELGVGIMCNWTCRDARLVLEQQVSCVLLVIVCLMHFRYGCLKPKQGACVMLMCPKF